MEENGYPTKLIRSTKHQKTRVNSEMDSSFHGSVSLPYIEGTTERLKRILFKHGVKVFVKPYRIIAQSLNSPKYRVEDDKQTRIVYYIPCATCDTVYIGEIDRTGIIDQEEGTHGKCTSGKTDTSPVAEHAWELDHCINWDGMKTLVNERRWAQRRWVEAWVIANTDSAIANGDQGRILRQAYLSLTW